MQPSGSAQRRLTSIEAAGAGGGATSSGDLRFQGAAKGTEASLFRSSADYDRTDESGGEQSMERRGGEVIHPSRSRGNRTRLSLAGFGVMPWKSNTIAKVATVLWIVSRFKPTGDRSTTNAATSSAPISSISPSTEPGKDPHEALGRFRDAITP